MRLTAYFCVLKSKLRFMKIALVQDGLMCRAGGEQVALCFHKAFPDAPIFTQCYQPLLTFPEFKECDVRTTWLQKIAKTDGLMKKLFFILVYI